MIVKEVWVKITGRVQGGFFRQSCKHYAQQRGITGWVKNCSDGSVEALFQCDPSRLKDILTWVNIGPEVAQVKQVQLLYEKDCTNPLEGFNIIREDNV